MSSKKRARGVEFLDAATGVTKTAFADTVVICSGSYESPKLLMLSKSNYWPDGVGNDHDLVGRHLISHSMLAVRGETPRNEECWYQEYDFPTLMSRTYDSPAYQKDGKIMIFKNRAVPAIDFAGLMAKGLRREKIVEILTGRRLMEMQAFLEEKGKFENRLKIGPGKNRFGLPNTIVDFNRTPKDNENAQSRLTLMSKVITTMNYKLIHTSVDNPGGHHTTGTCRMGKTPEIGVVDENLRVHETDNLYVCSNATFPTGSAVNPTLTLTALTMRLADHLG